MCQFQQSKLEMKTLFLPISKLGVGTQHNLQMPG